MNGNRVILDTNAVLYFLGGKIDFERQSQDEFVVSFITELELLSFPKITDREEAEIRRFLKSVRIVDLAPEIKGKAVEIRKRYRLLLPDAIICATAVYLNAGLVSYDKEFKKVKEVRMVHGSQDG